MNKESTKNIGAIVLSRFDSSRLPGKALKTLGDKALLRWPVDALKQMPNVKTVIATSTRAVEQPILEFADANGISLFKGDLADIAKRILDCCETYQFDYFFRINGDSPFINIPLLKKAINLIENEDYDLVTNLITRTYPYGLSCELVNVASFRRFYSNFTAFQSEHITNFYYNNLREVKFAALPLLSEDHSIVDWAIDTKEDLMRMSHYLDQTSLKNIEMMDIDALVLDYKTITNTQL